MIDGGKGLRKAVQDVLGTAAVIQRCQIHKARNLQALLPKPRQAHVRATLRRAYRAASADAARRQLKALGSWLESNGHVDAAASLREGLEETLTVLTLGLPTRLQRFFATTNCIENLIGTVRHVTRNVKRWRDGRMIRKRRTQPRGVYGAPRQSSTLLPSRTRDRNRRTASSSSGRRLWIEIQERVTTSPP